MVNIPPFPPLEWDRSLWAGEVVLQSWAGFQSRRGAYGAVSSPQPSGGSARLVVSPLDAESRTSPTAEQAAAFRHLIDNEAAIAAAVHQALVEYHADHVSDDDDDEAGMQGADLRTLVGLIAVHVLSVVEGGTACVGFEFGCEWDEEHGVGVMTHRGRVIAAGHADYSFVEWIARRGLGQQ